MQRYEMFSGLLRISDEELGIDIADSFDPKLLVVKKEEKEGRLFSISSYLEGGIHGPSLFYGENGTLVSSSWFCRNLREGRLRQYYATGALYAIQGFVHGVRSGPQHYYDPNGSLRTVMHYEQGVLDGEMILYWPNGQIKRHLILSKGKKIGTERFWNAQGVVSTEIVHVG